MPTQRKGLKKVVVVLAACSLAWVIGATLFYESGDLNPAGVIPGLGSLIALWGAVRSEAGVMWVGTGIVLFTAVAFLFSVGLIVAPAAVILVIGSIVLSRGVSAEHTS
jgi:hypothetical protein